MPLALATCTAYPALTADDQYLSRALHDRGVTAVPLIWDDPRVEWRGYDAVVIRSCWDYHQRSGQFLDWLNRLEQLGANVINPIPLLRWNLQKSYLRELAAAGVPVAPTAWIERGETTHLSAVLQRHGWREVVVKPVISATAFGTWRSGPTVSEADDARFVEQVRQCEMMVQPYLRSIEATGELSLVFLGGDYSHAVCKRPMAGDFRVQSDFGGTVESMQATAAQIAQAAAVVAAAPRPPLYARVDGCEIDGRLVLMELELIEPVLFLANGPHAAGRMADALLNGG